MVRPCEAELLFCPVERDTEDAGCADSLLYRARRPSIDGASGESVSASRQTRRPQSGWLWFYWAMRRNVRRAWPDTSSCVTLDSERSRVWFFFFFVCVCVCVWFFLGPIRPPTPTRLLPVAVMNLIPGWLPRLEAEIN